MVDIVEVSETTLNSRTTKILHPTIILETSMGDIMIHTRPDLSRESVVYIQRLMNDPIPCTNCKFYRAQDRGILQGVMKKKGIEANTKLGACPREVDKTSTESECHGPIMTRGMVGWAGGDAGPDFFINNYLRRATWWDHQHTVFGEVDPTSWGVVESFFDLPRHSIGEMTFLDKPISFEIKPFSKQPN